MDVQRLEERYLKINKIYSIIVGMWPNQKRKTIPRIFVELIGILGHITQGSNIILFFSLRVAMDQIPFLIVATLLIIKYNNFIINEQKFKELFISILNDWQKKKTHEEVMILEKYADKSLFFILIYVVNAYFCAILFLILPLTPILLDIFIPLNESRPRVQMYPAYYYIENEADYYYPILIFSIVSLLTAMCVFIATDTTLVYIVQHACGLLALAGYRFRNSLNDLYSSKKDSKIDEKICRRLCYAIETHKRALAYLTEIEDFYSINIFAQVGASILCLTITMMKIATITWSMETNQYYGYVIAQVVHIFFLTAQGQFVIDSHDNIYWDMYEPYWYNMQYKIQAMFVLILRRNLNPPLLTAGGLMQLNLNTFAEVVKTSVSYFTVLKSV
ncbi:odorant receptor 22c-like [Apis cerana]|uniref:odorant receptor 22c-like n=1 Tax=Apis cerana TaxID=7461 RepID=UPI002B22FBAB|nr:odorant receptor 22c-like [Apis cerana]